LVNQIFLWQSDCKVIKEGRRKKEEGRRKKEEGRRKKEEGRRKKGNAGIV
jgi:competence protein ComEC